MPAQFSMLAADAHVHIYPEYDARRALSALSRNLARLAAETRAADATVMRAGFLTESRTTRFFEALRSGRVQPDGFSIAAGPDTAALTVTGPDAGSVFLIAGRQVVTDDRLEVLGLGLTAGPDDGLSAEAAIEAITEAGGIPVLAWSPGKWLFKRGRRARTLIERYGRRLALGDTALRPMLWPEPALMRAARGRGIAVLPGSDPLPLPDEERMPGAYGLVCRLDPDGASPLAALRRVIETRPESIQTAGQRRGTPDVLRALVRLRTAKRTPARA